MNERIKQLWENSDTIEVCYPEQGSPVSVSATTLEKFALLIVRECVEKLKETKKVELPFLQAVNEYAQELPLSVYIAELNGHFGVEE
jgi:hypothetical protein